MVWVPPFLDAQDPSLGRKSALTEAVRLSRFLMENGVRLIVFCTVRPALKLILNIYLIPLKTMVWAFKLTWIFIKEIVRLYSLPDSIMSNWNIRFTSKFWHEIYQLLETKLLISTIFHSQTDRATKWVNHSIIINFP